MRARLLIDLWRAAARKLGDLQARAVLTVFYVVVVGPFALAVRLLSDPLAIKRGARRGWRRRSGEGASSVSGAARQF